MLKSDPWIVFDYEVSMFQETFRLAGRGLGEYPWVIRNAVVESLLLHTRILVEILLSRGGEDDDIRLKDMLPGFTVPELDELATRYGNRKVKNSPYCEINKKLAHATIIRADRHDWTAVIFKLTPTIERLLGQIGAERASRQSRRSSES